LHQLLHQYLGGDYVLAVGDLVYRLDDQEKPASFAGLKVKVTGTLNQRTKPSTWRISRQQSENNGRRVCFFFALRASAVKGFTGF